MAVTQVTIATPANQSVFTDTAMGATADAIKASSTVVYYITIDNSANGAASYVKLFNLAAGSVTVGTTVPDEVIYVPASGKVLQNYFSTAAPGKTFGIALSAACVTVGGTTGNTAPSSSVVVSIIYA